MTLAAVQQCSEATARALTDQLRQSLTIAWDLLVEAYQRRAWAALGYPSWDAYTDAELGETRLRLPREQRREVVASMTEAGMSTRAISSALGVSKNTVTEDRQQVSQFGTPAEPIDAEVIEESPLKAPAEQMRQELGLPEPDPLAERIARELAAADEDYAAQARVAYIQSGGPVLGTDGKTYTVTPKPAAQRRRPLPQSFWEAAYDLTKVTERIERLADDDRFPQNADEVAARHRNDLVRATDALQGVVNRLPSA